MEKIQVQVYVVSQILIQDTVLKMYLDRYISRYLYFRSVA